MALTVATAEDVIEEATTSAGSGAIEGKIRALVISAGAAE